MMLKHIIELLEREELSSLLSVHYRSWCLHNLIRSGDLNFGSGKILRETHEGWALHLGWSLLKSCWHLCSDINNKCWTSGYQPCLFFIWHSSCRITEYRDSITTIQEICLTWAWVAGRICTKFCLYRLCWCVCVCVWMCMRVCVLSIYKDENV